MLRTWSAAERFARGASTRTGDLRAQRPPVSIEGAIFLDRAELSPHHTLRGERTQR